MVAESTARVASFCIYLFVIFVAGFIFITGLGGVGSTGAVILTLGCGGVIAYAARKAWQM